MLNVVGKIKQNLLHGSLSDQRLPWLSLSLHISRQSSDVCSSFPYRLKNHVLVPSNIDDVIRKYVFKIFWCALQLDRFRNYRLNTGASYIILFVSKPLAVQRDYQSCIQEDLTRWKSIFPRKLKLYTRCKNAPHYSCVRISPFRVPKGGLEEANSPRPQKKFLPEIN